MRVLWLDSIGVGLALTFVIGIQHTIMILYARLYGFESRSCLAYFTVSTECVRLQEALHGKLC